MHTDTTTPPERQPTPGQDDQPPPDASPSAQRLSVFTAPDAATHQRLYGDPSRLARRTRALHAAKVSGSDAAATLADLAAAVTPRGARIADIGCGRGTSSLRLAARLEPAHLTILDRSHALLDTAVERVRHAGGASSLAALCADFHHLPLPPGSLDLAVAAFCLYHSPTPARVLDQIALALARPGQERAAHAVLATKNTTSYVELDQLMAATGLDPDAVTRPSLYAAFHSTIAADVARQAMDVVEVLHEQHVFRFTSHDHLAAYLSTTPKYPLPAGLATGPVALARELARRGAPSELTTTSTVTYVVTRTRP